MSRQVLTQVNADGLLPLFLCTMKVYKVYFAGDKARFAVPAPKQQHGDIELTENRELVIWYAIESPDLATAIEVAEKVVQSLWSSTRLLDRPRSLTNLTEYWCKN